MNSNTRMTPDRVGRIAAKVATEATYLAVGLADVVAGTVQDVIRQGRQTYTERKAEGGRPVADYARQVPGQMKGFAAELKDTYESLAARGRTVVSSGFSRTAHRDDAPAPNPRPQDAPVDFEQPPTS